MAGLKQAFASALLCLSLARAATVSHDFNITWVTANPDGAFDRPTIGINGQWPIPRIDANIGDRIIINVDNQLGNQSTSLHFHGLFMNGTTQMDGPSQVSQCPIPPGSSFTYNFTVGETDNQLKLSLADTTDRSNNQAHTGTTRTHRASTLTVSEARLLSMTRISLTRTTTTKSLF